MILLKLTDQEIEARGQKRIIKTIFFIAPLMAVSIFVIIFGEAYAVGVGLAIGGLLLAYFVFSVFFIRKMASLEKLSVSKTYALEELMIEDFFAPRQEQSQGYKELEKVEDSLDQENNWCYNYLIPPRSGNIIYSVGVGLKNNGVSRKKSEVLIRIKNEGRTIKEQRSQWGCFLSFEAVVGEKLDLEVSSPRKTNLNYVLSISAG